MVPMGEVRACASCGRKLDPLQELYCSNRCRVAACRRRKLLDRLPASIGVLQKRLVEEAPPAAIGYRLGLTTARGAWLYPHRNRRTLRFNGHRIWRPYF